MVSMVVHYNYLFTQSHMVGYLGCFRHFALISQAPVNIFMINQVTRSGDASIHPTSVSCLWASPSPELKEVPQFHRHYLYKRVYWDEMYILGWKCVENLDYSRSDLILPLCPLSHWCLGSGRGEVTYWKSSLPFQANIWAIQSPDSLEGWFLCTQAILFPFPFVGGVWLRGEAYVV